MRVEVDEYEVLAELSDSELLEEVKRRKLEEITKTPIEVALKNLTATKIYFPERFEEEFSKFAWTYLGVNVG